MMDLRFELPAGLGVDKLIASLDKFADVQLVLQEYCLRTYYDSFDWRLYQNEILCEFNRSRTASNLVLKNLQNGRVFATLETPEVPHRAGLLKAGKVRTTLETYLEPRALLPLCSLEYEAYHLLLRNEEKRIILRLLLEDYELLNSQLTLQPVRGFLKTAEHIAATLAEELGMKPLTRSPLDLALALEGRKPNDYSSKLKIDLDSSMRADLAVKFIFGALLKTMKLNEQGVIADLDSEFLHDFRVAVRRSRTGLSQLKDVLTADVTSYFADFFSWLGQVTGPTRDLDVYLAKFERYMLHLPADSHADIEPFLGLLQEKRAQNQRDLAEKLSSAKYRKTLTEWEHCLKSRSYPESTAAQCPDIKTLADRRIWKIYRRVVKEGRAITPHSPAENLHELRKTCKKLRYLIEFFQSLYPRQQVRKLIKQLKGLQDVLGDFQDLDVQIDYIDRCCKDNKGELPPATLRALDELIHQLTGQKARVRKHYQPAFDAFVQAKNQAVFKALFAGQQ
ncbi:CYTH and CHAD domain-containing protein [Candidatus Methylomicrobium oryzae]|jgi:CHAD domain-containing protein|uniref:CYTH and CHAD domain-containing protein n=1 Tax=Candidatus Methylomicrobium oryzae TaxID=2802053 RepID=UPI001921E0AF|nr:CHAD domain-containing protein [Methylomicrobium sp. RS1]MBL1265047.1 CHAD domain-containing protein [Methylomicrobium sp. RS1]